MSLLRKSWYHDKRVFEQISRPGFIHELKSYYIWVSLEGYRHFFPICCKFIKKPTLIFPQMSECFVYCPRKVDLTPAFNITCFGCWKSSFFIEIYSMFFNWCGERVVNLLWNRPNWNSICTELLTE